MKIIFLISTMGHGRGGHFSSLKVTAESLSERLECTILNIGVVPSAVLKSSSVDYHFVDYNGVDFFKCLRRLATLIEEINPDVIHSFDTSSHFFARLLCRNADKKIFHTKCGGPNPKTYYPFVQNLVLYSRENLRYFRSEVKYKRSSIELLPNRVVKVDIDTGRINELRQLYGCEKNVFLRISRFSAVYEKSLRQAIELLKTINERTNREYKLLIVGAIQDKTIFERIKAICVENVHLVTDDRYTNNANQLVDIADYVIGTGRGFMEAASLGKILLAPVSNSDYPVLVREDNFEHFFEKNFSPRAAPDKVDSVEQIAEAIESDELAQQLKNFSLHIFNEFFSIDSVVDTYVNLYQRTPLVKEKNYLDLFINFLIAERNYYSASKAQGK